ncbi:MAG: hypothetical protein KW793_04260 [Candidatus Doudnabacteria bacterium]|nr:hypothetical protein [Candidatus Doudnabacteria bacterium]
MDSSHPTVRWTHRNDLNGQRCIIVGNVARDLMPGVVAPNYIQVMNEDETEELIFPWEVTEL